MALTVAQLAFIDSTGYHFADYPSFLDYIQSNFRGIYGQDTYLGADSQDGQLTAVFAQALYDTGAQGSATYNSFIPGGAQGVGLARLVKINGINKNVPTNSTVDLTIIGQAGTTITNGIAVDSFNQQWILPTSVTIPGGGSQIATATAQNPGMIAAAPGTITGIFTPTNGWQTVNNVSAASPGQPVESDAELRARQVVSVANPSLTVLEGTLGAVLNVPGVAAAKSYENPTNTTDANSLPPHSFSIVVEGGDITAIAQAIADHKTPGTQTVGNTPKQVFDNHGMPITINFNRPTPATIGVQISLTSLTGWTSDFENLIAAAVSASIQSGGPADPNSSDGGIGDPVYITTLYGAAYLPAPQGQTYVISGIQLQKNGGGFASSDISLLFTEIPVCSPDAGVDIVFVVT